jgi:hypothetical protein
MLNGDNSSAPWFLQAPGTSDADMRDISSALSTLSDIGMEGAAQNQANKLAQFNASRGVSTSSEQARNMPGFQQWWQTALSAENANKALKLDQVKTQRRAEGSKNFFDVSNWLRGERVDSLSPTNSMIGASANRGGAYGNMARNYQSNYMSYLNDMFGFAGDLTGSMEDWARLYSGG